MALYAKDTLYGCGRNPHTPQKTPLRNNPYDLQLMATQEECRNVTWTRRMGGKEAKVQPKLRSPTTAEEG